MAAGSFKPCATRIRFRTKALFGYQIGTRDVLIQGREERTIRLRQMAQMTLRDLFGRLDPTGKVRHIMPIRDARKWCGRLPFAAIGQQTAEVLTRTCKSCLLKMCSELHSIEF